jgi:NAD(P)-dependent dehydrogenase (short-subunit alcohol dehydrogenase family)
MRLSVDLGSRVAIVTGASSGLGARFASVLATAGATVVAAARRPERLAALAESQPGIIPFTCDVTDVSARARLVEAALEVSGQIDVLVNNAGTHTSTPAVDEPVADFERTVAVNLTAVFALSQLVAPHMLSRRRGSIINIASILGTVASAPIPQAGYCAAKGAVVNLTRELACQWAPDGVRVNAVAPGWFPSELTEQMFADERSLSWVVRNTPMGRPGEPEELDGVLMLLASDASTFMTGQTLVVDGGWTSR